MRTNYKIVKMVETNTYGEFEVRYRINYTEFNTLYTLKDRYYTRKEAVRALKEIKAGRK